jgi:shikimate dehydrogenase
MQQAAFDAVGIAARYESWDTPPDALHARVAALREPGMLGANVTIPHKVAVIEYLDDLSAEVKRLAGAVNTIVRYETMAGVRLVGYNTDVAGLLATFHAAGVALRGKRLLLLGAGGAAQAMAAVAAQEAVASLAVAALRAEAGAQLLADTARRLGAAMPATHTLPLLDAVALGRAVAIADVLVNATPVGLQDPSACPIDPTVLAHMPERGFVLDMLYAPRETALVRAANALGLAADNGLSMLLHQGAAAFELWTGREAPLEVMRAALGLA